VGGTTIHRLKACMHVCEDSTWRTVRVLVRPPSAIE
jgi:hypothetical protein